MVIIKFKFIVVRMIDKCNGCYVVLMEVNKRKAHKLNECTASINTLFSSYVVQSLFI